MKINEQDIFNFVFYPHLLNEEVKEYLTKTENYTETIIFYKELKSDLESNLSFEEKRFIASKIDTYKIPRTIYLNKLKEPSQKKKNITRLAAASTELKPGISTKTFLDVDKEYIVKVLSDDKKTKIFVFSAKDEIVKDFDLIIGSKELEYHMKDNAHPLEINGPVDIDKIELRFN